MNILVLNYEYPPIGGGGGIICKNISEYLSQLGHNITILTVWIEGLPEFSTENNMKIIRLKSKRKNTYRSNPIEMLSWISHAKKYALELCKRETFDFSFAHFIMPGGEVGLYLRKKIGLKYIAMSHGHDVPWVKPINLYFYHSLVYHRIRKICNNAEAVFVQSEEMQKNMKNFLGEKKYEKIFRIHNGINVQEIASQSEKDFQNLNIIFSGRLVAQKAPFIFLKALLLLKDECNYKAYILGNGPLFDKIKCFIEAHNLSDRIFLLGKVPHEKVIELYAKSHLMVSSSVSEGMSISIIEALASGCYVMATPASGNRELITENTNGNLFDFGDSQQLAILIEGFYNNKFLHNWSIEKQIIDDFCTQYDWQNIVKKYDEVLKQLIL